MRRVVVVLLVLCGTASAQVTNGADDDADPAAVGLRYGDEILCSGVVVSPRVVLTAAHCADATPAVVLDAVPGDAAIAVTAIRRHPAYDPQTLDADLAMLVLAEPAPTAVTWFAAPVVGATVRVVGYGRLDAGDLTPARRRVGTATVTVEPDRAVLAAAPSQPCTGDSGGPVLDDDVLIGVTSSGDPACSEGARAIRVDRYLDDFIQPFLDATADGAAPPGAPCYHDDNCDAAACVTADDDPRLRYCSPACTQDADCPDGMRCADGCRYDAPSPGALGSACTTDEDCVTGACARDACTQACVAGIPGACPTGYACVDDQCFADAPGCGCSSTDPSGLLLAVFLVPLRRRVRCADGRRPGQARRRHVGRAARR